MTWSGSVGAADNVMGFALRLMRTSFLRREWWHLSACLRARERARECLLRRGHTCASSMMAISCCASVGVNQTADVQAAHLADGIGTRPIKPVHGAPQVHGLGHDALRRGMKPSD